MRCSICDRSSMWVKIKYPEYGAPVCEECKQMNNPVAYWKKQHRKNELTECIKSFEKQIKEHKEKIIGLEKDIKFYQEILEGVDDED